MRKKYISVVKWVLILLATFAVIILLHQYGTYERGYPAVGGEALFLVIPILLASNDYDKAKRRRAAAKGKEPSGK